MNEGIKIAVIGGIFGLLGSIVGQLDKVADLMVSIGIKKATHIVQLSESYPPDELCNDSTDLGRVLLHSSSNGKTGIFFCPQGISPNYNSPSWHVASGINPNSY